MSIERYKGDIQFICDECEESELDSNTSDFQEALEVLKMNSWTYLNIDGEWVHICPNCNPDDEG